MALSSFLPSATSTLANSAPWFSAFYAEFAIYLYIGVGVLGAIMMINFLISNFDRWVVYMKATPQERKNIKNSTFHLFENGKWSEVSRNEWDKKME